jgi:hypothetical protein
MQTSPAGTIALLSQAEQQLLYRKMEKSMKRWKKKQLKETRQQAGKKSKGRQKGNAQ